MEPKIAVYTLTRDRLEYTQHCFASLWERAGCQYDHYVVDNGSEDGTPAWLRGHEDRFAGIIYNDANRGISGGSNQALDIIGHHAYDFVVKMDNDCELVSSNMLPSLLSAFRDMPSARWILSPRVEGIVRQPTRGRYLQLSDGSEVGVTGHVGGLFCFAPAALALTYRFPLDLPKAYGQDSAFCNWVRSQDGECGYVESLVVHHYETTDGQARRYPEYFRRKWEEEKL